MKILFKVYKDQTFINQIQIDLNCVQPAIRAILDTSDTPEKLRFEIKLDYLQKEEYPCKLTDYEKQAALYLLSLNSR